MTLATLRPDGWPQATTVGFAHEDLTLYFLCGPDSQKARNLSRDARVSLTIDHDADRILDIVGLSMAGRATRVRDEAEAEKALRLVMARYGPQGEPSLSMPRASQVAVFRIAPEVISVLDYSGGFGHTDLLTLERAAA